MSSTTDHTARSSDSTVKRQYTTEVFTEDIEDLERYSSGGYHPLSLNDYLNGRYQIIHKLGYGAFSVVWLARDDRTDSNVAIKVLTAENDRSNEVEILNGLSANTISTQSDSIDGQCWTATLLNEFQIHGPNGSHRCLVTTPASGSLHDAREDSEGGVLKLEVARVIIAQLVSAVAFVHSKGVVHGDLHLGNALLRLPHTLVDLPADDFYEKTSHPELIKVKRRDGGDLTANVPSHAVERVVIGSEYEELDMDQSRILLSDFGESFRADETVRLESRTPLFFKAPEHLLPAGSTAVTFSSDIWSLACMIFPLMGQRHLFQMFFPDENSTLRNQMDAFGAMPAEVFDKWADRGSFFTDDQQPIGRKLGESFAESLDIAITRPRKQFAQGELGHEELQAFEKLLRSMFQLAPEKRISAQEVLESEWMVQWALPDLKRAQEVWASNEQKRKAMAMETEGESDLQGATGLPDPQKADGEMAESARSQEQEESDTAKAQAECVPQAGNDTVHAEQEAGASGRREVSDNSVDVQEEQTSSREDMA